jgi:UDP-N-acetylmuramoyl-L-alanyl-D-glutamate--2,6-diaminopimelate ligase
VCSSDLGGVATIGMQHSANVTANVIERFKSEQTFLMTAGNVTVPVRTMMIGDHHVYNCMMATAIGLAEGIDLATIARGLEAVQHVPGRLERIECGQPFGVYVDFAHTPDALAVSLSTLREVTAGRLYCVFGAGGNRDRQKRPAMGQTVEALADVAIVTSDNPRFEDANVIGADILSGFQRAGDARWIPDRIEAIHYALSLAGPDDCVLVAGRGHEQYQIIGNDRLPLDDRDVVRRWLYNLEPAAHYGALMSVGNS